MKDEFSTVSWIPRRALRHTGLPSVTAIYGKGPQLQKEVAGNGEGRGGNLGWNIPGEWHVWKYPVRSPEVCTLLICTHIRHLSYKSIAGQVWGPEEP